MIFVKENCSAFAVTFGVRRMRVCVIEARIFVFNVINYYYFFSFLHFGAGSKDLRIGHSVARWKLELIESVALRRPVPPVKSAPNNIITPNNQIVNSNYARKQNRSPHRIDLFHCFSFFLLCNFI